MLIVGIQALAVQIKCLGVLLPQNAGGGNKRKGEPSSDWQRFREMKYTSFRNPRELEIVACISR
jgi:hypothetical protein